jgi:hypothetical protein
MNEGYNPKYYFDNGRTFECRAEIFPRHLEDMACGEIFTILGPDKKPHSKMFMDSHNQIREKTI